jgi:hypothetical protein
MTSLLAGYKQVQIIDRDASEIGQLYSKARESFAASITHLAEVGGKLILKKQSLSHGD